MKALMEVVVDREAATLRMEAASRAEEVEAAAEEVLVVVDARDQQSECLHQIIEEIV